MKKFVRAATPILIGAGVAIFILACAGAKVWICRAEGLSWLYCLTVR